MTLIKVVQELKHKDITKNMIGASFEVHKFLGNACLKAGKVGLSFARKIEQEIYYKELSEPIGTRRADFNVEGMVLVELKALKEQEDVHLAQVLNYLKVYKLEVGLLINFSGKSLTSKRLIL